MSWWFPCHGKTCGKCAASSSFGWRSSWTVRARECQYIWSLRASCLLRWLQFTRDVEMCCSGLVAEIVSITQCLDGMSCKSQPAWGRYCSFLCVSFEFVELHFFKFIVSFSQITFFSKYQPSDCLSRPKCLSSIVTSDKPYLLLRWSFSTATPLTWNSLPPALLNCDFLSTFKTFKTRLFYSCFLLTAQLTCFASAFVAA